MASRIQILYKVQATEVEETLKRIQSHRGVEGVVIINHDGIALKSTLTADETSKYASEMARVSKCPCV